MNGEPVSPWVFVASGVALEAVVLFVRQVVADGEVGTGLGLVTSAFALVAFFLVLGGVVVLAVEHAQARRDWRDVYGPPR